MQRILLVEDDENVTRAMTLLLRDSGFDVQAFHTGTTALRYVGGMGGHINMPAAAIVDIHLPDINGLVLSAKLRQQFGDDLPIIVLSGDTSMETLNSLPHVGATYFFSKPVNAGHLIGRLKEWLPTQAGTTGK